MTRSLPIKLADLYLLLMSFGERHSAASTSAVHAAIASRDEACVRAKSDRTRLPTRIICSPLHGGCSQHGNIIWYAVTVVKVAVERSRREIECQTPWNATRTLRPPA